MKNDFITIPLTELSKAIEAGFIHQYIFIAGLLYSCFDLEKGYAPSLVIRGCFPCVINQHTVYRVETPEGIKGTAQVAWSEFETSDF